MKSPRSRQYVWSLDDSAQLLEQLEGDRTELINLLGGKGGNLALMTSLGVPVSKGFVITTQACSEYYKQSPPGFPPGLREQQEHALRQLEEKTGKRFNDPHNPLLVSVRSGARVSMPGMMDTVLNCGLNDTVANGLIEKSGNPRWVWDTYRRLISGYGTIVMGIKDEKFEEAKDGHAKSRSLKDDAHWEAEDWRELCSLYKAVILRESGREFPQDPLEQIQTATLAVFDSWNCERAKDYRANFKIPEWYGTAVTILTMTFGNLDDRSCTGVAFTRDPSTGKKALWGDFLIRAQGEDVVAGIRNTSPIAQMAEVLPEAWAEFVKVTEMLERHFKDVQDVEFTVESGKLWMCQTRSGKRTAQAAVKIVVDMVEEGLITKEEAIKRISAREVDMLLHPFFADDTVGKAKAALIASGVNASPGAGVGQVYFSAEKCKEKVGEGQAVVLVRRFTKPDDVGGMLCSKGVLTCEGGAASHAAVVARQLGIPAVVGCSQLELDLERMELRCAKGVVLHEGDWVSLDGTRGKCYQGQLSLTKANLEDQTDLLKLLGWADEVRSRPDMRKSVNNGPTRGLQVWANADTPEDAQRAVKFGAEGVGLCRTEHMFLGDRAQIVARMILAKSDEDRDAALDELERLQVGDFQGIFKAMTGKPVIIRLIDPPLHEFLPDHDTLLEEVVVLRTRRDLGASYDAAELAKKEEILAKARGLRESNPMLGSRGVRLCLVVPGLVRMQIRAIIEGACLARKAGAQPHAEIMVPLTMSVEELSRIKPMYVQLSTEIFSKYGVTVPLKFGTMIEVPRACLTSRRIAAVAEFYSFGSNDLHQMTMGLSRDDSEGTFLQHYYAWGLMTDSPFQTIDVEGVGRLMEIAVHDGREARPDIEVGICGEHGGDPRSIEFCSSLGMNYVSCSPFRVPIARLAAAKALL